MDSGYKIAATLFAGIGLFLVGLGLLSENMKRMSGGKIRGVVSLLSRNKLSALFGGAISGAITNSAKAVTFTAAGLISSDMMTVKTALPVIVGASVGSSLLVLWAVIDFKLLVLVLLGIVGIAHQYSGRRSAHTQSAIAALLGLGLLFYGLQLLKMGAKPIREFEWFETFIMQTQDYSALALIVGAVLAFIAQSGTAVSIIAITLTNVGLLSIDQTVLLIYGTNIGSGIGTWILATTLRGTARRLGVFHACLKVAGSLLLVPLLYIENWTGLPCMKALVAWLAPAVQYQVALLYLIYEMVSGAMALCFLSPISTWLERLWPAAPEEEFARLKYIETWEIDNVEDAMELVSLEHTRYFDLLPRYLDEVRDEVPEEERYPHDALYDGGAHVRESLQDYLAKLFQLNLTAAQSGMVLGAQSLQAVINALSDNLHDLIAFMRGKPAPPEASEFITRLIEGVHMLLMAAADTLKSDDTMELDMLAAMTGDRGALTSQFKEEYFYKSDVFDLETRTRLLDMIVHYEQLVGSLREFVKEMQKRQRDSEKKDEAPAA